MNRIVTVPNLISLLRLLCVPWFLYLIFGAEQLAGAAYLLAVLGVTDWVDGYIARKYNQVSTVGKVVDPSVDRVMLLAAAVALLVKGAMPLWFGVVALGREALVGVAGVALGLLGARRIDVRFVGKTGTFALMISLPLFLLSVAGVTWHREARFLAWVCGIPGLVFSWISVLGYATRAKTALKEGRSQKEPDRVETDTSFSQ